MKKLTLLIATIILISCNSSPLPDCLVYDTVRINVDVPFPVFDSLAAFKIDSMTQVYYDDIDKKRAHFIGWRDSTENELIKWLGSEKERLFLMYDSLKRLHIYDNMIIQGDSLSAIRAEFDSITGKPILIFE